MALILYITRKSTILYFQYEKVEWHTNIYIKGISEYPIQN